MDIPKVLENLETPTLDETLIQLMNSIVKEEFALSSLLESEAKKIEAFVGKDLDFPTCPTSHDILEFNHSINKMVDSVLMKEWLLLRKLETVIGIKAKLEMNHHNSEDCIKHKKE